MTTQVRIRTGIISLLTLTLALGFAAQASWATGFWPWEDGRLSYIVIGAVLAGGALALGWAALARDSSALRPILLDAAIVGLALGATFLVVWARDDNRQALLQGTLLFITGALLLLVLSRLLPLPFRDERPAPALVRWSFACFTLALLLVAGALLLRAEHIFPWPLKPESSVAFGAIFLGSAAFYAYGFWRPVMGNVYPQLLAFLAYDLVLAVPLLRHFGAVRDEHRLSLVVYVAVVAYSAALAFGLLFLHPRLRLETSLAGEEPAADAGETMPPAPR